MFTTFSSVPSRPSPSDVLWEVQDVLDVRCITFGALIVNALRDTATLLGATIIPNLASILEAPRPHLDEDKNARALLGRFLHLLPPPSSYSLRRTMMVEYPGAFQQRNSQRNSLQGSTWRRWRRYRPRLKSRFPASVSFVVVKVDTVSGGLVSRICGGGGSTDLVLMYLPFLVRSLSDVAFSEPARSIRLCMSMSARQCRLDTTPVPAWMSGHSARPYSVTLFLLGSEA